MAWHEGQTCEEYDSDIDEALAEARRQKTLQERKEAKGKKGLGPPWIYHQATSLVREQTARQEAVRQEARREEARRQEAARQKALADAEALKRKHALDNKASLDTVKSIAKTCPNKSCGAQIQKIDGCDHMTCKCMPLLRSSADRQ